MRKKYGIIACIMILTVWFNSISVNAYTGTVISAIDELERFDIVRNPREKWTQYDFIARRDAFKMPYIITVIGRSTPREFLFKPGERDDIIRDHAFFDEAGYKYETTYFKDVEVGSDDDCFVLSLMFCGLMTGREENGEYYAALDEYMTYNEAFATIYRLLKDWTRPYYFPYQPPEGKTFFSIAEEFGLINNNNSVYSAGLTVSEEQLNDPIPAYEYMYLLDSALYIPRGDGWENHYLVEYYVQATPREFDKSSEDIID